MSVTARLALLCFGISLGGPGFLQSAPLLLPTANRSIFQPGGESRYFAGTVGKPWTTGTFGCVRTEGRQLHEGIDIRSQVRDSRGEPADDILATADGTVTYINRKAGLSNYGIYVVLRHEIEGIELYSLYAHLSRTRTDLKPGQAVKAGETIATMGRTSNTRERIGKDRAHLHFELALLANSRFESWFRQTNPGQRNDHGIWNGQNLLAIDPRRVFLEQERLGPGFSFAQFLKNQEVLCKVVVRQTRFSWLSRYPLLAENNPVALKEGVAAYELSLNFNGVPFRFVPRAASELQGGARYQLVFVSEAEAQRNACRRLVSRDGARWQLARNGTQLLDLLTH